MLTIVWQGSLKSVCWITNMFCMSLVPIHLSFILNSFRPFCSLDTQPVSAFVWILVVACVAGVWKGRERKFYARETRDSLARKTLFPFLFKCLPRRLKGKRLLLIILHPKQKKKLTSLCEEGSSWWISSSTRANKSLKDRPIVCNNKTKINYQHANWPDEIAQSQTE